MGKNKKEPALLAERTGKSAKMLINKPINSIAYLL